MKSGIDLITEERARQVSQEGWTAEHDDQHKQSELAIAGACYALPDSLRECGGYFDMPLRWPFHPTWYKPESDRVRELVKAGALIAAEIDRLQRKAASASTAGSRGIGGEDNGNNA